MKGINLKASVLLFFVILQSKAFAFDNSRFSSSAAIQGAKIKKLGYGLKKGSGNVPAMSSYLTDECEHRAENVENELSLRNQNMRRCIDGTVSFIQPDSEGWKGWEGKCGQVVASNMLFMFCRVAAHPTKYSDKYMRDLTPGVRSGVLADALTKVFDKNWEDCPSDEWENVSYKNSATYFWVINKALSNTNSYSVERKRKDGSTIRRSPVAALIRVPRRDTLHWVTIVDILRPKSNSCEVVINHWDEQYTVPCLTFARWSYGVWETYGPLYKAYTIIRRK